MAAPELPVSVCVDAGTTLIKAVVFDSRGEEIASASVPTAVSSPRPGWSEQDMTEVWRATAAAVRDAVDRADVAPEMLVLTAQGDGAWLVDAQDRPVRPAILWNDARSRRAITRWQADGALQAAFERNGSLGNLGLPHAILATLLDEETEVLGRADAVLTCGSWLFLTLTGRRGLHPTEASAPWLDIRSRRYGPELLELYGLGEVERLLPPVLTGTDLAAPLGRGAAQTLGLPAGIPVVMAPYDIVVMATGSGVHTPGQAYSVLGTTLCTGTLVEDVDTSGAASGLTLALEQPDLWLRAFPTLAGTGVLETVARLLGLDGPAELGELARHAPPGAGGLTMWPYLSPAGERAPFLDVGATGVLAGLQLHHDRTHVARATLEGLAHVVRDCVDAAGAPAVELRLCGGGAVSDTWAQIIADVTGVPTVRTRDRQVGAKGALIHALVATGRAADVATASEGLVEVVDRRQPDAAAVALHRERHRAFLADRDVLASRWRGWGSGTQEPR